MSCSSLSVQSVIGKAVGNTLAFLIGLAGLVVVALCIADALFIKFGLLPIVGVVAGLVMVSMCYQHFKRPPAHE